MRNADQPIRISLFAPDGRMGKAIAAAVADDPGFAIDNDHGDVLVDFSSPAALEASLDRAVAAGIPILIGTTGLSEDADAAIAKAARQVAVLPRRQYLAWQSPCWPSWSSARRACSDPTGTSRSPRRTTGMKADAPSGPR